MYVVAGGTLEDFFTDGMEGDVIARSGNTLTVRGGTLFANAAQVIQYEDLDSQVIIGPGTLVTADGVSTLGALDFNSIAVGQHITARGLYSLSSRGRDHSRFHRILDGHGLGAHSIDRVVRLAHVLCFRQPADEPAGHRELAGQRL